MAAMPVRVLFLASLYPNREMPGFAPFVEHRVTRLCAAGLAEGIVVAPVPRYAFAVPSGLDRYRRWRAVPSVEIRRGLEVHHPRYAMLPGPGMYLQPFAMYRALRRVLARLPRADAAFDLIDAHYAYPDGVAAALLARDLGLPFFVTGRGTDLNSIPRDPIARRWLRRTLPCAAACIAVSGQLAQRFRALGADPGRVHVVRNGVDRRLFRPHDRAAARRRLGLDGTVLLHVGELSGRKGTELLVEMLPAVPGATLLLVGDGRDRERLARLAGRLGVAGRVRFEGPVPQDRLALYYSAADLLVLASRREGTPNVVLEAMACGTRVVACAVGGVPEVLPPPPLGFPVVERKAASFARRVREALAHPPDREALRAHAARFDWNRTVASLHVLMAGVTGRGA